MLKVLYLLFGSISLANGGWMLILPFSWYENFPASIPHTGPFNSHFVRDLGVAFLVMGVAFVWSARHIDRSYAIHLALTSFFTGHALIHIADIAVGRLPQGHLLIDTPGVFLPALLMLICAVPSVRRRIGG